VQLATRPALLVPAYHHPPSAMAQPSLTYFAGRGLGEIPRLLLAEAGVQYTDNRRENIDELKASLPFGQVPLYEEPNGVRLVQSNTISRYIARQHNLYGKNAQEAALIDQWIDGIGDFRAAFRGAKTDEEKAKFKSEALPKWFGHFEKLAHANFEKHHVLVGDQFSWADIALYYVVDFVATDATHAGVLANHHTLAAVHKLVAERPRIAHWLKTRPVTPW